VEIRRARFIAPPLSSREYDAASAFTSSGRRPRGDCCQPDYSVSFPGKPDLHCPCRYPERFFRRAPIFSPGVSGGHSRLSLGGPFHRPRGCRDFLTGRGSYGLRLPALISDPTGAGVAIGALPL